MPPNLLETQIFQAVQSAIGPQEDYVLLHRPYLPPAAWDYVKECMDTGWVSSAGAFVTRFEEELAEFTGVNRAVAVVDGTAALEVCLHLAGVSHDEEVWMPSLTFVATANATMHLGASPHFIDVDPECLGMCPQLLSERLSAIAESRAGGCFNRETGKRIAAVCPMHCFGLPCDLDALVKICGKYEIPLVEDAAESLGSYYKSKHTGRHGKLAAVSFNGNKIMTTGGGGAILTDDEELADRAKHLTTTAKKPDRWEFHHDAVAWNYRMPNINAAMGVAQLEKLPEILAAKRQLHDRYQEAFAALAGVEMLTDPAWGQSNCWLNCILIDEDNFDLRESTLTLLNENQLQCRPLWQPMHTLPMFENCPRSAMTHTEAIYRRAINIPSSADLAPGWQG